MIGSIILLRAVPVLLLLILGALLLRRSVVRLLYERRPRVWRAEWSRDDAPSQVEIAEAIRRAQAEELPPAPPNKLELLGMGRCRVGMPERER